MSTTGPVVRVMLAMGLLASCLGAVAARVPPASAAPAAPYSTPVPAPLTDLVTNGTHAFATSAQDNLVHVLSLANGALEASIPVGTSPMGLDLSKDGSLLYVANAESNDVSVVDVALRREVRRLTVPAMERAGRPYSIAVGANGTALLSRRDDGRVSRPPLLLSVDLATGVMRQRPDWFDPTTDYAVRLRPSADRSSIGVAHEFRSSGAVSVYTAATDSFGPMKFLGDTTLVALDGTGSKVLVGPDTFVLDGKLVLRATIPGKGDTPGSRVADLAVGASGSTAYRLRGGVIEVVDLSRALVTAAIDLPEPATDQTGRLALTPDGTTLVALTANGFSVAPVSAARAKTCTPPTAPAGVVPVCGAPLGDLVADNRGRAYVSNTARNQIEVVSLTGRRVEASISVGSQPTSLDLSPDGNTLYVLNSGAEEMSVVDVVQRREVRRVTVPVIEPTDGSERLFSLAVAGNGTALVITRSLHNGNPRRLFQIDLATGTSRPRTDTPHAPLHARASADHSRIGFVSGTNGAVFAYNSGTDSFTKGKDVSGSLTQVALDGNGSEMLVGPGEFGWEPGIYRLDRDLIRRGTIANSFQLGMVVNPAGNRVFSVSRGHAVVADVQRAVNLRFMPLPEILPDKPAALVPTPDDSALAVLSPSGISFVSTSGGTPLDGCPAPPVPSGVTAVCGELADVVSGGGKAYVTNATHNRVEVISLADGTLEAPILVGSRPRGLDFSADGRLLYVALYGAEEVSVVDVAQRRELRRITVPSFGFNDRPSSIAVTSRGSALVTTSMAGSGYGGRIHQIDLATERSSLRRDFESGTVIEETVLEASGDRSRVLVVGSDSGGLVTTYLSDSDTVGPGRHLNAYLTFAALDGSGHRALFNTGTVLDGDLRPIGDTPGEGKGVVVNRAGTTGYRVLDRAVEVIDLSTGGVVRTFPLPEPVALARGAIALSADEQVLTVLTSSGVSLVPIEAMPPRAPYTVWAQPGGAPLDGTGTWVAMADEPQAVAGQLAPSYLFGHYFSFPNRGVTGAVALVTQPAGKFAVFSLAEPGGPPRVAAVPFDWREGGFYFLFVYQVSPGRWGAWVYDHAAPTPVPIGSFDVPLAWGGLSPATVTVSSWAGGGGPRCGAYPLADVMYYPPIGFRGAATTTASLAVTDQTPGACPARTSVELGIWARHRLGAGA